MPGLSASDAARLLPELTAVALTGDVVAEAILRSEILIGYAGLRRDVLDVYMRWRLEGERASGGDPDRVEHYAWAAAIKDCRRALGGASCV